ncbi:hypothetical protein [Lacticaseibacillus saniviri]|nr:hypothetical protein [Lacticaseibacillus saniviri]
MIDYITATKIITAEFKGMYIDLAPEGFPMEEDEFNELMTKLKFTFGDNDV